MDEHRPPPRLKSGLWVQALVRQCDLDFVPATVAKRGDPDAGSILLKIVRDRQSCVVYAQVATLEGGRGWMRATGPEPVAEPDADAYVARQAARDSDLWVVEIDDPRGRYVLEGVVG